MRALHKTGCLVAAFAAATGGSALAADVIELSAAQAGGYYAGSPPDNLAEFQNYFVGYGTSPGSPRTPERRSFFVFDLAPVDRTIASASLHLTLKFGGLIYGKGPGDPAAGPVLDDPVEEFVVGVSPFPTALVTSPGVGADPATVADIFASFAATPVSDPFTFSPATPIMTDPLTGDAEISIPLTAPGIAALNAASGVSGKIVLTGWMPTWSPDARTAPGDPAKLFEGSELIFGFSDVHSGLVPAPVLELTLAPVPEPAVWVSMLAGLFAVGAAARRRPRGPCGRPHTA